MSDTFDHLARFVSAPRVPQSARDYAALLLIDTLGVAAGAQGLAPARISRDFAADFHAAASPAFAAPMLFDGRSCSIPGAAFAAATQIDNLDGHDGYNPTKGHIGCAVVPALFAFAHAHPGLTAREGLDILVMSYEVSARAAIALHRTTSDYHTSGAWNALGVAAIGCHLLGADRTQLREALGIAEYHGPRSQMMREIAHPTMLHDGSGMGALTGSMAALLAIRGFQGAPAITVEDPAVADIWADLGAVWTVELNYIKPYPICRWAHAPLDALAAVMKAHKLHAKDIAHLHVRTFAESAALYPGVPETTGQAQYSLAFSLAVLMRHGHVGPEHIAGDGLKDREVAALLDRITVAEDPRHSRRFPLGRWADLTVTLTDGTALSSGDMHARGGPESPMSEAEIEAKLMSFAGPTLGQERAAQLWEMGRGLLREGALFSDLAALVTPAP